MTKIIQLYPKNQNYYRNKKSLIKQLNQFEEKLMKGIINLALNGEWKAFNDSTEIGTICTIDLDSIAAITDPSIVALRELQEKLLEARTILERNK